MQKEEGQVKLKEFRILSETGVNVHDLFRLLQKRFTRRKSRNRFGVEYVEGQTELGVKKHINGEYSDNCLYEVPIELNTKICLYESVDLSFNCLHCLPDWFPLHLPHLSFLDISHNQLESLPEGQKLNQGLGLLFHLRILLLSHNNLNHLPDSLTDLQHLQKLDVSDNNLIELPDNIGHIACLEKLNVSRNQLTGLPKSLGSCHTLRVLLCFGNKCVERPPQSVCDDGSEATITFMHGFVAENPKHPSQPINCFPRVRGNQVATSVPNPDSARAQYVQLQTETMNTASRVKTPLLPPPAATRYPPDMLRDKIIGLVYGAAIGDALGLCTEFLPKDECMFHYQGEELRYGLTLRDSHRLQWQRGDWTSNADQMFLVLDSILGWGGVVDELDFAQRLLRWKSFGFPNLGDEQAHLSSHTIRLVLQEESYASCPHSTVKKVFNRSICSNGSQKCQIVNVGFNDNGAAARAPILGVPRFHDLEEVRSNSLRICQATHASGPCRATCVALAVLIAQLLQGTLNPEEIGSLDKVLNTARDLSLGQLTDSSQVQEFNICFLCNDFFQIRFAEASLMSHTYKPLCAAVASLRSEQDFKSTLTSLVMCGGHASVNACVAGAVLGCHWGYQHLPRPWIEELLPKQRQWANGKINALLDIMGLP